MKQEIINGNPITVVCDRIGNSNWIIFKDSSGNVILKMSKILWNSNKQFQADILMTIMQFYG